VGFAAASKPDQDKLLGDLNDEALQNFIGAALANTLEAMYGPPEYGGNRGLVGWSSNGWTGDTQPRGFSRERVTTADRTATAADRVASGERPLDALSTLRGLPDLSGRPTPHDAWWLGRGRFGR
jgi:hypothetical protein